MARIYPFRALRYNPAVVRLQDVVTQPYDKISPAMQQAYYQSSPYNLVRIILGLPELFDGAGAQDVYRRAARDFEAWRSDGILTQESEPCVFAYSQTFTVPGTETRCERKGFIALGELYDYAANVVFRHEQTLSRPKSDRLNLLRATRANFGQIFMLYSDPGLSAERLLFQTTAAPDIEVTDEYGVTHKVWRVSEAGTINLLTTALEDKKLIIADGHHRYETALEYSRERAPAEAQTRLERSPGTASPPPYPEAAAMMTFVNMDQGGLAILPTHRLVYGLADFDPAGLIKKLEPYFEVKRIASASPEETIASLRSAGDGTAMIAVTGAGNYLLKEKPGAASDVLSEIPERQRSLDIVQLHTIVLEKTLGISPEDVRNETHVRYLRDAAEAMEQVAKDGANAALRFMHWIKILATACVVIPLAAGQTRPATPSLPPAPPPTVPAPAAPQVAPQFLVLLDAAHGGTDIGARLTPTLLEKDLTLDLANRLRSLLAARGISVTMTRVSDETLPTVQRAQIADGTAFAACLLIHATATGSGVHLYTSSLAASPRKTFMPWDTAQSAYVTQSMKLSSDIDSAMAHAQIPVTLGRTALQPMDSYMCPAVAVEIAPRVGGSSTKGEAITDGEYQRQILDAIAAAVDEWRSEWRQQP